MIGIVKFFNNDRYLDALIAGTLYCNTPEYYRQSKLEGVSDKNESCLFSFRPERGDDDITLELNGVKIKDIKRLTAYNPEFREAWLQCWMTLEIPNNDEELIALQNDVQRIQTEFGRIYAFIRYDKITPFLNAIKTLTDQQVIAGKVAYSEKSTDCGPNCKAISYSYQREFRFLIGECGSNDVHPLILNCKDGFREYIEKCPEIVLRLEGQKEPLFELMAK